MAIEQSMTDGVGTRRRGTQKSRITKWINYMYTMNTVCNGSEYRDNAKVAIADQPLDTTDSNPNRDIVDIQNYWDGFHHMIRVNCHNGRKVGHNCF